MHRTTAPRPRLPHIYTYDTYQSYRELTDGAVIDLRYPPSGFRPPNLEGGGMERRR